MRKITEVPRIYEPVSALARSKMVPNSCDILLNEANFAINVLWTIFII
jgi:hypothetical protein